MRAKTKKDDEKMGIENVFAMVTVMFVVVGSIITYMDIKD